MFSFSVWARASLCLLALCPPAAVSASTFNGQGDFQRDDLGYYYAITGGKFPTGTTPNGDNGTGGTFRFITDDPDWGSYPQQVWNKDDWFPENASIALTLRNGSNTIVYDNNGIEDNTYGEFYDASALALSGSKPGLYRGYSMSNNYDWIYAGYFKIEVATEVKKIIGFFDANSGFDPGSDQIRYDMNIWSAQQDDPINKPNSWMPSTASFSGDVLSAKTTPGQFVWSDSGVDRVFGTDLSNGHDDIFRLEFTLDNAITLQPGVYFFSHDAEVIPEPLFLGLAGVGVIGLLRGRAGARD